MISESLERFNSKFKAQRGFNFRLNLKRLQIIPVPPLSSFRTGPFQVSAKISHCNTRPIYAVVYPILLFIQTGPEQVVREYEILSVALSFWEHAACIAAGLLLSLYLSGRSFAQGPADTMSNTWQHRWLLS